MRRGNKFLVLVCLTALSGAPAFAAAPDYPDGDARSAREVAPVSNTSVEEKKPESDSKTPPTLKELQDVKGSEEKPNPGFQIRVEAQKEAALSYGARGGLSWRTYEIRSRLKRFENSLTRTYDFRQLLITAPSELFIEPPIVAEAIDAINVENGGQDAAVADKVLKISSNAKIVTAPRDWRHYLEREWAKPELPPNLLLPRSEEESKSWKEWVAEGWKAGLEQADDIFQSDIDRLNRDFVGMVKYRQLLTQAIVNRPFAVMQDRGVTGGGVEMRIGDRAVRLTGPVLLSPRSKNWNAAPEAIH